MGIFYKPSYLLAIVGFSVNWILNHSSIFQGVKPKISLVLDGKPPNFNIVYVPTTVSDYFYKKLQVTAPCLLVKKPSKYF